MATLFTPPAYGIHRIIKDYAGFPRGLPMPCYFEHSINTRKTPSLHELMTRKKLMLVVSKRRKREYLSFRDDIQVEIMGLPHVYYRRMRGIEKKPDAAGTVVFPSHSTEKVDSQYTIDELYDELMSLDREFHPVRVCLHWYDILRGKDRPLKEKGLEVVTAGDINSLRFVHNLYDILSSARYTCSNDPGTYSFLSVEMGIPFFIIGRPAVIINDGNDPNYPSRYSIIDYEFGKAAYDIFNTGPVTSISSSARRFVIDETGIEDSLSASELKGLLWKTFFSTVPHIYVMESIRFSLARLRVPVENWNFLLHPSWHVIKRHDRGVEERLSNA